MSEKLRTADANMAEIARLRTDVASLRAVIEQQQREIEAERAARARYDRIVAAARVAVAARDRGSYVALATAVADYDKVTQ